MQRFLPLLPDWETGDGGETLDLIAEDVEGLLASDAASLWAVARDDPSLLLLAASFLQYAKRPHDPGFQQQPPAALAIWQRMLPLLHRLVCGEERGAPGKADRAGLLGRLLDLPRLLDVCALYGAPAAADASSGGNGSSRGNSPIGRQLSQLVAGALELLPRLGAALAAAGPVVAQNLGQVAEACLSAAGKAARDTAMAQSLQDGVVYLRDTCLTLASLVQAYPPAAGLLLQQGPELIEGLGAVHDKLLPAVHRAARAGGDALAPLLRQACHVQLAAERLAQQLLLLCYVSPPAAAGGSGASAAGSSSSGGAGGSAVARGEALLHALMLLGHQEEEAGGAAAGGVGSWDLAQALAQRLGLGGSIEAALQIGSLSLDDAQADYVAALLGVPSLAEAPGPMLPGGTARAAAAEARLAPGGGRDQAAALDLEQLRAQIQQVKDLLPDYGDGFVAACLQQLGGSPERVLNALLEGSLPPQLAQLDTQLSFAAWQAAAPKASGAAVGIDTGKGKAPAAPTYDSEFPAALPGAWAGGSGGTAGTAGAVGSSTAEALARAARAENKTARYLDVRDETYREALLSAAAAAQMYDDEYDDSFDDLIAFGADGVTEMEGEEGGPAGPSGANRGGAAAGPSMAAAQRGMQGLSLQPGAASFQPGGGGAAAAAAAAAGGGRAQPPPLSTKKTKGSKLWVLEGRIYNYPKPGAQEVGSQAEAEATLAAAQQAAQQIMGLGPGGNKPWRAEQQQAAADGSPEGAEGSSSGTAGGGRGNAGRGGGGGGRGPSEGGRGRGGGRGGHKFKDQHKGAIANHHRRDRAIAKQARGMF